MRLLVISTLMAGIGQFATLLCGAVSIKVLAIMAGPAGLGLFSVLRQAQQVLSSVATIGGQNAVIQCMASVEERRIPSILGVAFWAYLFGTVVTLILLAASPRQIQDHIIGSGRSDIIFWLGVTVVVNSALVFSRSILNAKLKIKAVTATNVMVGAASVVFVVPASISYQAGNESGLLILLAGSLLSGAIYATCIAHKNRFFDGFFNAVAVMPEIMLVKHFLLVSIPSLITVLAGVAGLLVIRLLILDAHGLAATGFFEASYSLSAMYTGIFLASLQTYWLPTASIGGINLAKNATRDMIHFALLVSVPLIIILIVLKPIVVELLYSPEFLPALSLLRWILLGDLFKILGGILTTLLIARRAMVAFIVGEILWNLIFLIGSIIVVPFSLEFFGPVYLASYISYLFYLIYVARKRKIFFIDKSMAVHCCIGVLCIVLASAITWNDTRLDYLTLPLIILAALISWLALTGDQKNALIQLCKRRIKF